MSADEEELLADFCLLHDDATPLDVDSFATIELEDHQTLKRRLDQFCGLRAAQWELSALPPSELACSTILLVGSQEFSPLPEQPAASKHKTGPPEPDLLDTHDNGPKEKKEEQEKEKEDEEWEAMDEWLVMSNEATETPLTSSVLSQKMHRVRSFFGSLKNPPPDQNPAPTPTVKKPVPKTRATPQPAPPPARCDLPLCTSSVGLHPCYKCGKKYCGSHSREAGTLRNNGWKRELRCVANTSDDVLFDMLEREHAFICERCEEDHFQGIGQMVDHTKRFQALRVQSATRREELIASHLGTIGNTLLALHKEMEVAPIATSIGGSLGPLNVMKNVTWRVKETYSQCGLCEEFFERFSIRNTCQLCRLIFCQQCGVSTVRFSPQLFPQIPPMEGHIQLPACTRCRLALGLQSRRSQFQNCKKRQRIELVQERHTQVQQHRDKIDQLLEQYFSFSEASPHAIQCKNSIEAELNFYESRSRSLETMARQPLKGTNLNRTEIRFLRCLENTHQAYLRDRITIFRLQSKNLHLRSQQEPGE